MQSNKEILQDAIVNLELAIHRLDIIIKEMEGEFN
jgi:hypothetical protein